jgi:hypothetical protein
MKHSTTTAATRLRLGILVTLGGACTLAALGGCDNSPTPTDKSRTVAQADVQTDTQCADLLQSVRGLFRLEDLGVTSDIEHGISILNQWQRLCQNQTQDEFDLAPEVRTVLAEKLPAEQLARVRRALYTTRDGEHLRDCLLFKAVQDHAVGTANRDLGRAINLFQHVVWNVQLVASHPEEVPLSPYEIYLVGQGTAEDRAWLFAELLRQLKIDAVIVQPQLAGEASEARRPFLVGVLLDNETYLFDPTLGLPVPTADSPLASGPDVHVATLAQVQADPALLKQFDLDPEHPYPIRPEQLQNPTVAVIGQTCFWSPRLEQLQPAFTGARAMVIYDGLVNPSGGRGLLARVASSSGHGWDAPPTVWPYPESQLQAYASMTAQQQQMLLTLTAPLNTPYVPRLNAEKRVMLVPERIQFRARIAQTQGKFENAVKDYTFVQLRCQIPAEAQVAPEFRRLHQTARAQATFWIGVCKLAQGKPADRNVAVDKFRQYLKDAPDGTWVNACREALAAHQAEQGHPSEAVTLLEEIPADHPQHLRSLYLIHHWRQSAPPEKAAPENKPQ